MRTLPAIRVRRTPAALLLPSVCRCPVSQVWMHAIRCAGVARDYLQWTYRLKRTCVATPADGKSERGDHPVVRMPLRQWMLAITRYADRLLGDLEAVDWDAGIKALQRAWIGRSEVPSDRYIKLMLTTASGDCCERAV